MTRALGKLHLWQEGTDLRAWLFTILHNQYVNYVRRSVREGSSVGLSDNEPLLTRAPQQGQRLELRDLERAIAKLPEEQQSAILLVGLEGMRYEEVAAVLDVPVGTVRSRLSRGREALRKLVGIEPDDGEASSATTTQTASDRAKVRDLRQARCNQPQPARDPHSQARSHDTPIPVKGSTGTDATKRRVERRVPGTNQRIIALMAQAGCRAPPHSLARLGKVSLSRVCHPQPRRGRPSRRRLFLSSISDVPSEGETAGPRASGIAPHSESRSLIT